MGTCGSTLTKKPDITDRERTELVRINWKLLQNAHGPFKSTDGRSANNSLFYTTLGKDGNGETIPRTYLFYSPFKEAVYCFCCLLFSKRTLSSPQTSEGFTTWSQPNRISTHERSSDHRKSFLKWKELEKSTLQQSGIDAEVERMYMSGKQKWRLILYRILDCIKLLARQGLAFRGHRENISTSTNPGNFLALIKLLGKYDNVLQQNLSKIAGRFSVTSYLSPEIQNEFINLLAKSVKQNLLKDIMMAKYYGMIWDSTPDLH